MPVSYPGKDGKNPRKVHKVPYANWDLNKSGLYSFKVVKANPNGTVSLDPEKSITEFSEFVLPVNPNNLQISVPFAINTTATTGGVVEEHNGIVFRNIAITGTFGIAAVDSSGKQLRQTALGTSNSLGSTFNTAQAIQGAANGEVGKLAGLVEGVARDAETIQELGFAKINDLGNWLIDYAEFKKTADGKDARLVFIDRKNGINYVVTPISFDMTKDAADAHLVRYRVALKGWDLATKSAWAETKSDEEALKEGLTTVLNSLRGSRLVLAAASLTLRGVVADFDALISTVNEVGLLVKDAAGVAKSIADFDEIASAKFEELKQASAEVLELAKDPPVDATNPYSLPVKGSQNTTSQQLRDNSNPLRTPEQRLKLIGALDQISLNAVVLTSADQDLIDSKLSRVRSFTIADFDAMRSEFEAARDAFADSLGLNDATYDDLLGREPQTQLRNVVSKADYKALRAFNDLISVVDSMSATKDVLKARLPDPFVRAQTNANNPEVVISSYSNGFPVPFPHKGTLEQLALTYLGDANKWQDIVVANNLKTPYVDEDGFERAFTSNGVGRVFTVSDASHLHKGQEIWISSTSQLRSRRTIIDIKQVSDSEYIIEVDGDESLANYTKVHNAKLFTYLPGTINSNKMVIIPTNKPVGLNLPQTRTIPATQTLDRQQKSMGVDFAITDDFDIALTNGNDAKLATGVANALQAVKIKLGLEKGGLKHHPELGLGIRVGEVQDLSVDEIRASLENAILSDPRFEALTSLNVQFDGSMTRLNMRIKAADGSDVIPLSFTLN